MDKIKIPQYLARGKHRWFHVLRLPELPYAWAYDCYDDGRYEIDGNIETFRWLKYALAVLIQSPDRIVYLPIRKEDTKDCIFSSYDAVITRPELQFRRSEWIKLRRQLNAAHRVSDYRLQYRPERYNAFSAGFENSARYYRARRRLAQEVDVLLGSTVFLTLIRESCCLYHNEIEDAIRNDRDISECFPISGFAMRNIGWIFPDCAIQRAIAERC